MSNAEYSNFEKIAPGLILIDNANSHNTDTFPGQDFQSGMNLMLQLRVRFDALTLHDIQTREFGMIMIKFTAGLKHNQGMMDCLIEPAMSGTGGTLINKFLNCHIRESPLGREVII